MDCEKLKGYISNLESSKSIYCYDFETLNTNNYCINLNYKLWLSNIKYEKYCLNNNQINIIQTKIKTTQ